MPITTDDRVHAARPLWQRLLWFVALWAGGVLAVGAVGYAIKLALRH